MISNSIVNLLLLVVVCLASQQSALGLAFGSRGQSRTSTTTISGTPPSANGETKKKSRRARIKKNEKVVFFPTAARRGEDGRSWDIPIHGWIYEPETRDIARRAIMTSLRKYLGLSREDESAHILIRRVGSFLVSNEKRKELSVQIGCPQLNESACRIFQLPQSKKNGHFEAILNLGDEGLAAVPEAKCDIGKLLHYQAVTEQDDDRSFQGVAQLIPPEGISIISDIDDTVKITGVGSKKKVLRNTFMEEFKQVPGMAELYQQWSTDLDAKFHFVSSSPWQLWEELAAFLNDVGFPQATYHMKPIRIKDKSLFDLWKSPLETKISVIESILDAFPKRKFVLVGDTGEKDPEVYGEIARKYPNQIQGIYVRNVTNETGNEERYREAWKGLNRDICGLFTEASDLTLSPIVVRHQRELVLKRTCASAVDK